MIYDADTSISRHTLGLVAGLFFIRLAKELSQEKFAEQAGLDYKYYQHIEAGRRPNPEMVTLLKLAKGTGLELWQLLKFDDPPPDRGRGSGETRVQGRAQDGQTADGLKDRGLGWRNYRRGAGQTRR